MREGETDFQRHKAPMRNIGGRGHSIDNKVGSFWIKWKLFESLMSVRRASICCNVGALFSTGTPCGISVHAPQPSEPTLGNHSEQMSMMKWAWRVPFSFLRRARGELEERGARWALGTGGAWTSGLSAARARQCRDLLNLRRVTHTSFL